MTRIDEIEAKRSFSDYADIIDLEADRQWLMAQLKDAVSALEFYATLADRDRYEPFLRREFGCGCCAGINDKDGKIDFDSDVQGLTARECLARIKGAE